jgi:hypothetical protein
MLCWNADHYLLFSFSCADAADQWEKGVFFFLFTTIHLSCTNNIPLMHLMRYLSCTNTIHLSLLIFFWQGFFTYI